MTDDAYEREMALLREGYRGRLQARVDAIARGLLADHDPDARKAAISEAHRLRGTAGSYGFAEVGFAAGALEDGLLAGDEPRAKTALAMLQAAVREVLITKA